MILWLKVSNHSALTGGSVTSSTASASRSKTATTGWHTPPTAPPARLLWRQLVHRLPSVECLVRPGWTTVEGTRVSASGSQRGADLRLQHTDTPAHTNLSEKGWILPFSTDWCVLVCRNPATCCGVRLVQNAAGREAGSVQRAGGLRRPRLVACTALAHGAHHTITCPSDRTSHRLRAHASMHYGTCATAAWPASAHHTACLEYAQPRPARPAHHTELFFHSQVARMARLLSSRRGEGGAAGARAQSTSPQR